MTRASDNQNIHLLVKLVKFAVAAHFLLFTSLSLLHFSFSLFSTETVKNAQRTLSVDSVTQEVLVPLMVHA